MLLGMIYSAKAQTVIFEDSFETYEDFAISDIGEWTLRDLDEAQRNYGIQNYSFPNQGAIPSFIVFNPTSVLPTGPLGGPFSQESNAPKTGDKYMVTFASYNLTTGTPPGQIAVEQSDWLISPQITLGSTENVVTFWAKSYTLEYGAERFKVLVSSNDTETASFTAISTGNYVAAANTTWTEYTYNIPASYNSQSVYIAIQCVSIDSFMFMVDDFKVTTTGTVSNDKFFKENFKIFPNPTSDVLNISAINGLEFQEVSIIDMTGRVVKSISSGLSIDVSDLASGTYVLYIETLEGKGTSKFIKK